ncbi:hypothetical protein BH09BAC4_BH09BAC4_18100 [soil metagenome]
METQSLWPDFAIETTKSPKAILKEQAGYLMAKTNNVLSAEVDTVQERGSIVHQFYVVAPAMNNYRYKILSVTHGVIYYPLTIEWDDNESPWEGVTTGKKTQDQDEFIKALTQIFNDPSTVRVISSLLSQSLAE